jgi:hypothetical protein
LRLVGLVVLVLAIPATVAVLLVRPGGEGPEGPTAPVVVRPARLGPGLEPPVPGGWPPQWQPFGPDDRTKELAGLDGLGFSFLAPPEWSCTETTPADAGDGDGVRYDCGADIGEFDRIGGELTVRACPDPCDPNRRVNNRRQEEAWGQQWNRAGSYICWAESTEFLGDPRYGIVVVGYWRSAREGPIDRQVVIRMTGPPNRSTELQTVVSSIKQAVEANG